MRINCSLIIALAVAILASGCGATKPEAVAGYPDNTIVVQNKTPYILRVSGNGSPWFINYNKDEPYHPQFRVMPKQNLILEHCTTNQHETMVLGLKAWRFWASGCEVREKYIGNHNWTVEVGTNSRARLISVRNRDF